MRTKNIAFLFAFRDWVNLVFDRIFVEVEIETLVIVHKPSLAIASRRYPHCAFTLMP